VHYSQYTNDDKNCSVACSITRILTIVQYLSVGTVVVVAVALCGTVKVDAAQKSPLFYSLQQALNQ
jgi:hypothetical protein